MQQNSGGEEGRGRNDKFHASPSVVEQVEALTPSTADGENAPIMNGIQSKC